MTDHAALDGLITAIEERLHALGCALRDRDARAIENHAHELHRALAVAVQRFAQAAHTPEGVPGALRQRLVRASGLVAAQRESLARAMAALDRAIDVLMPGALPATVYAQRGPGARAASASCVSA
jgi:HPt (histidine-containing phosphotransfer) domain-containing protein